MRIRASAVSPASETAVSVASTEVVRARLAIQRNARDLARQVGPGAYPRSVQLTSESQADVIVQHSGLPNRPRVLQLKDTLLLHSENDAVLAANSDGASTLADSLERVIDLLMRGDVSDLSSFGAGSLHTWKRCPSVCLESQRLGSSPVVHSGLPGENTAD